MRFGPQELLLVFLIVLLLFGASRLPRLARSMREARDEFQKGADEAPPAAPPAKEEPVVAKESPVPEAHTETPEPAPPTEQEK